MRKFVVFLALAGMLAVLCPQSVYAEGTGEKRIVVSDSGYEFSICERNYNNTVIRTFREEKTRTAPQNDIDYDYVKVILKALGMQTNNINRLNEDALQAFSEGKEIIVATSYSKNDSNDNVTFLSEAEALTSARQLKDRQKQLLLESVREQTLPTSDYYDSFQDSYMRVNYAVSNRGNGEYFYCVDSEWLTMPSHRSVDSLGACSMNGSITVGSQYGYYWYNITYINGTAILRQIIPEPCMTE